MDNVSQSLVRCDHVIVLVQRCIATEPVIFVMQENIARLK